MDLGLKDKVAVVSAGATGIGLAYTEGLLAEGARVAICSRRASVVEEAVRRLRGKGYDAVFGTSADASEEKDMRGLADAVFQRWGGLDLWFNNAATDVRKPMLDCTVEEFDRCGVMLQRSMFVGTQAAVTYMRRNKSGVIINTSSFSGQLPTAGNSFYSGGKAAMNNYTAAWAAELAPLGIRMIAVAPGPTHSPWNDDNLKKNGGAICRDIALGRPASPEEIANVALFAASDKASFMTGVTITVHGGRMCVQNTVDPRSWYDA